jgi:2,4-dienoyl-CoA reductase-like NADH-dependent reductase (Old Yellow Enzyme family)
VKNVRKTIGNRLLLYRLGAVDLDPAGTQIADSIQFAIKLKEVGVDIIDVSGGFCGSRPEQLQTTPGYFVSQAHQIRAATGIPVIGVGGIRDPGYANRLIEEKAIDLIAVGRPMLNDAEWSTKFIQQVKRSKK